jgi:hypothetical protein
MVFSMQFAYAGIFSSEPPKDFMEAKIETIKTDYKKSSVSVQDVVKFYETREAADVHTSWEKLNDQKWLFTAKIKDKVSGDVTLVKIAIAGDAKGGAIMERLNSNGFEMNVGDIMGVLMVISDTYGKPSAKNGK